MARVHRAKTLLRRSPPAANNPHAGWSGCLQSRFCDLPPHHQIASSPLGAGDQHYMNTVRPSFKQIRPNQPNHSAHCWAFGYVHRSAIQWLCCFGCSVCPPGKKGTEICPLSSAAKKKKKSRKKAPLSPGIIKKEWRFELLKPTLIILFSRNCSVTQVHKPSGGTAPIQPSARRQWRIQMQRKFSRKKKKKKGRKSSEDDVEGLICHCSVSQEWPQETFVF